MIEIIEQNFFNRDDFLCRSKFSFSDQIKYFQLMMSPILNSEIQYKMQNQRKCYFLFIVWISLTKLCTPSQTTLRQLFNCQFFLICVVSLNGRMTPKQLQADRMLFVGMAGRIHRLSADRIRVKTLKMCLFVLQMKNGSSPLRPWK